MRWKTHALLAIAAFGAIGAVACSVSPAVRAPVTCASYPTRVDGVVLDREGHGVAGALVVPRAPGLGGDPLAGGVVTDREGRFHIVGLAPGEYWFVALHGGYPLGTTPAMPVDDRLVVSISLSGEATPA